MIVMSCYYAVSHYSCLLGACYVGASPYLYSLLPRFLSHFLLECFFALVEVLYDDSDKHVENEETDEKKEGNEVDHPPLVVVLDRLQSSWVIHYEIQ